MLNEIPQHYISFIVNRLKHDTYLKLKDILQGRIQRKHPLSKWIVSTQALCPLPQGVQAGRAVQENFTLISGLCEASQLLWLGISGLQILQLCLRDPGALLP